MSLSRSSTPPAPLAADRSLSDPEPRSALPRPAASTRSIYSFDLFAALITLAEGRRAGVAAFGALDEWHLVEEAYGGT